MIKINVFSEEKAWSQKLKNKESLRLKSDENENVENQVLTSLENFKIDKTSEN